MERNKAYIIALVAGAVAVILAVAFMVPYITGTDTGSELTTSAGTASSGETPDYEGVPRGYGNFTPGGMPPDMDGNVTRPDGGGGMMPGDLPEMDSGQARVMLEMIAATGIDTTDAETALEEGDMDTVIAFIGENMPARQGGPGGFPEGEAPKE